jgi:photosystem II stability/assembly factor-like uncharacterized protein
MKKSFSLIMIVAMAILSGCEDDTNEQQNRIWSYMDSPTNNTLYDVHFTDENQGWIAGTNTILKTSDGLTWENSGVQDEHSYDFESVYFFDSDNGVVSGLKNNAEAIVLYTRNGGASWNSADVPQSEHAVSELIFADAQLGYALSGQNLLKTTDGGRSWSIQKNFDEELFALDVSGSNIWVGSQSIRYSSDGGENWITQEEGFDGLRVDAIKFTDDQRGFAGTSFGEGQVYQTTDGGNSWSMAYSGGQFITDIEEGDEIWAADADQLIRSKSGSEWTMEPFEGEYYLNAIAFPTSKKGYAAGYNGAILKYE